MTSLKDPLTLGAVLYEGFELLDLYGPLEMFGNLKPQVEIVAARHSLAAIRSSNNQVAQFDTIHTYGQAEKAAHGTARAMRWMQSIMQLRKRLLSRE